MPLKTATKRLKLLPVRPISLSLPLSKFARAAKAAANIQPACAYRTQGPQKSYPP
jgi:hypothetical protein